MSRLAEFRKLEKKLVEQLAELESMKNDSGLKKEIEFEGKLHALLSEYDVSLRDVINILVLRAGPLTPGATAKIITRKPRQARFYKNPYTGEVIKTRGGNHKIMNEWKTEYGRDVVESWLLTG